MFYISLIIIQTILFEAHYLIYVTLRNIFDINGGALFVFKIIIVALSVSFLLSSIIARKSYNALTRIFSTAAAVWFGFLIYFLLAAAAYWCVVIFGGREISSEVSEFAGMLFFAAAFFVGIFGIINARNIRTNEITVNICQLPEKWVGWKAALISDVHLGQINGEKFAQKISEMLKRLSPDIVFFVGDVFDGSKTDVEGCMAPLSEIHAAHGVFFVSGNHEEFTDDSALHFTDALRRAGIRVLNNEKVSIEGVDIIGISDSDATNKKNYEKILTSIASEKKTSPRILLKHTPVFTDTAIKCSIDLELSGHTHGGQVFPFNIITPFIFKDRNYGLSKSGLLTMYTSSGVGTWGPPMRIGTDPEIVIINFQNKL